MTGRTEREPDNETRDVRLPAHRGVTIALFDSSAAMTAKPAVVLLHGGAQTRYSWGTAPNDLAEAGFRAISVDLRGHGDTGWAPDGDYSERALLNDLQNVVSYAGRPVVLVGASLGGLISMLFAARYPSDVAGLALVDVVPVNNQRGVNRIISFMNTSREGFDSFDEAVQAVARYQAHRPYRTSPVGLHRNLRRDETGRLAWHWDPDFLLRNGRSWTHGKERKLVSAARRLRIPTLLLVGADSDVVTEDEIASFCGLVPHLRVEKVAGASHMIAGDQNDLFGSMLLRFVQEICAKRS